MNGIYETKQTEFSMFTFIVHPAIPAAMPMGAIPMMDPKALELHHVFGYDPQDAAKHVMSQYRGQPVAATLKDAVSVQKLVTYMATQVDLSGFSFVGKASVAMQRKIVGGMLEAAASLTSTPEEKSVLIKALLQIQTLLTPSDAVAEEDKKQNENGNITTSGSGSHRAI